MDIKLLKKAPFHLSDADIKWVETTRDGMTELEKVGQLFCLIAWSDKPKDVDAMLSVMQPGGVMYRPMQIDEAVPLTKYLNEKLKIPPLIAANLEKGGNGAAQEGTLLGAPMGIAATDDVQNAERLGTLCGREGRAVGVNWSFAPIIDLDLNYHNPITNTRTFGSDVKRVAAMGAAYVKAVQREGLAASIKHFPGDGVDERDQHLLSSVNSLSVSAWDASYGRVWRAAIRAGALTAMVGHIMQPAWVKKLNPAIKDEDILPASLSPELMGGLLRGHLGFNGLIVTDASTMAGMTIPMPRADAVVQSIAAGADMFLFTRNLQEDFDFMRAGVSDGRITKERLNDAVTRILALKAALKLHLPRPLPTAENARAVIGCAEHVKWAKRIADRGITLVKEEKGVLPLDPKRVKRILYYPIEADAGFAYGARQGVCKRFQEMLEREGFALTVFDPALSGREGHTITEEEIREKYDLILYCINLVTKSNQTTVRIEWQQPMGANCPHYLSSVPTIAVSVENPYHLLDMPRVRTFINAYTSSDDTLRALVDKLLGRSAFHGVSPVDPFCGKWDARL